MPTLDQWLSQSRDERVLIQYVDKFIVGLIKRVGLECDIDSDSESTIIRIKLKRPVL
jgi:hypothetical protein